MALIFDTNALSAFADGDDKFRRLVENESDFAVPVIVLGEYLFGIQQSRFRARYEQWLNANLSLFSLLAVGSETAWRYAEVRRELRAAGKPIPSNDVWIAALTREYRLPLVTRADHFQLVRGLRTLKW